MIESIRISLWRHRHPVYRTELGKFSARHNYSAFLALGVLLAFVFSVFLAVGRFLPRLDIDESVREAESLVYAGGLTLSILFLCLLTFLGRFGASRQVSAACTVFAVVMLAVGVRLAALGGFAHVHLAFLFALSIALPVALSVPYPVYPAISLALGLLIAFSWPRTGDSPASAGMPLALAILVFSGLVLAIALERSRLALQIVSLQLADANKQLKTVMVHDPLTGAYNRHFLDEFLDKQLKAMKRYGDSLAILIVDIDHFKKINDTLGMPAGDAVLKKFVSLLMLSIRDSDIFARIGGEEFLIALPRTNRSNAFRIAEKLRKLIEGSSFEEVPWPLTVSIGVDAVSSSEPLAAAIARVDASLYLAKKRGRNRVEGVLPGDTEIPGP
jgi:diguanylate cyclase (GGDEF)-like protein